MSDFYNLLLPKKSLAILIGYPGADRVRSIVNSDASLVVVVEKDEKEAADAEAAFYGRSDNIVVVEKSDSTPIDVLADSYGQPDLLEINKGDAFKIIRTVTAPINVVSFVCDDEQYVRACVAWLSVIGIYNYHVVGVDNEYAWTSAKTLGFLEAFKDSVDFLDWMSRTAVMLGGKKRVYAVRVNR